MTANRKTSVLLGLALLAGVTASAQPSIVPGGVLNAASFAKNAQGQGTPVAPGSLVAIFGSNLGSTQADADSVPFSTQLGGVSTSFGANAGRMRDVIPAAGIINVQVPFEAQAGTTVNTIVTVNGAQSLPAPVQIVAQAPGIFSVPPGAGYALVFNLSNFSLAAPASLSSQLGLTSAAIPRSTAATASFAFFYATGLGAMDPPVNDGDAGLDGVAHKCVNTPTVTLGGISVPVLFAGQAAGFPGVYQVNIQIPANAPTGDAVDMQIMSADGTQLSPAGVVHIAIQ